MTIYILVFLVFIITRCMANEMDPQALNEPFSYERRPDLLSLLRTPKVESHSIFRHWDTK